MRIYFIYIFITVGILCYALKDLNRRPKSSLGSAIEERQATCGVQSSCLPTGSVPMVFKAKCATCHNVTKDATGPALYGVEERLPEDGYFEKFVRSQQKLLDRKHKYTIAITNSRPINFIHGFEEITDEQMDSLRHFLND